MANVMAARIVVFKSQSPIVPQTASATSITDGAERPWLPGGDMTWREYRHPNGNPIVVFQVASVTIASVTYTLCILWGLGATPDAIDPTLYPGVLAALRSAGVIQADWATSWDGQNLLTPSLDADAGAAAVQVKANWPATWVTSGSARCVGRIVEI